MLHRKGKRTCGRYADNAVTQDMRHKTMVMTSHQHGDSRAMPILNLSSSSMMSSSNCQDVDACIAYQDIQCDPPHGPTGIGELIKWVIFSHPSQVAKFGPLVALGFRQSNCRTMEANTTLAGLVAMNGVGGSQGPPPHLVVSLELPIYVLQVYALRHVFFYVFNCNKL